MDRLKLVATKIDPEWFERLEKLTTETGLTQSAILREAIGQYLGIEKVNNVIPVNEIRSEIESLKARLSAVEKLTRLEGFNRVVPVSSSLMTTSPVKRLTHPTGALTTGELFTMLVSRGYTKHIGTLGRALRAALVTERVPDDLIAMGVSADFKTKRSAKSKDSSVKWLFLD